jgi:hypothetical protein
MEHEDRYSLYEENYTQEKHTFQTETQVCDYYTDECVANTHTQALREKYSQVFHEARVLTVFSYEEGM